MNNLGSLLHFFKASEYPARKAMNRDSKRKSIDSSAGCFTPKKRRTLAQSAMSSNLIEILQADNRPEGFTYVSDHRDVESIMRISSANATQRPKLTRDTNRAVSIEKPDVPSRLLIQDPKPKPQPKKTVKMQEKIRNELL